MPRLLELVYVSTAVRTYDTGDLVSLLRQSREKNARLGITGILLYQHPSFMQLLEGPAEEVHAVYASIMRDERHFNVMKLHERDITDRSFAQWYMGFMLLDPETSEPGWVDASRDDCPLAAPKSSQAVRLLQMFREQRFRAEAGPAS
jgi:hypothetical protein